ncbi:unnamed protein product [Nesidiocoris tenuis]|uniref:Uncharacterized protein n=1 Tax=Nesidiocoris tenuis TaxID=355587 RepID=A0A6H5G6T7_9HEMI|nr:unnamed protein product [Nesidiocoris tenuis]
MKHLLTPESGLDESILRAIFKIGMDGKDNVDKYLESDNPEIRKLCRRIRIERRIKQDRSGDQCRLKLADQEFYDELAKENDYINILSDRINDQITLMSDCYRQELQTLQLILLRLGGKETPTKDSLWQKIQAGEIEKLSTHLVESVLEKHRYLMDDQLDSLLEPFPTKSNMLITLHHVFEVSNKKDSCRVDEHEEGIAGSIEEVTKRYNQQLETVSRVSKREFSKDGDASVCVVLDEESLVAGFADHGTGRVLAEGGLPVGQCAFQQFGLPVGNLVVLAWKVMHKNAFFSQCNIREQSRDYCSNPEEIQCLAAKSTPGKHGIIFSDVLVSVDFFKF